MAKWYANLKGYATGIPLVIMILITIVYCVKLIGFVETSLFLNDFYETNHILFTK